MNVNVIIFTGKGKDKADSFSLHYVQEKDIDTFIAIHQTTDEKYWRKAIRYYEGEAIDVFCNN
jgi:hypothetical protein